MRLVGVVTTTLRVKPYSMSPGSARTAASRIGSPGTNNTTISGVFANAVQYDFEANCVMWALTARAWSARSAACLSGSLQSATDRYACSGTFASTTMSRLPARWITMSGRTWPAMSDSADTCVLKSQCSLIPASSTTRSSCSSPQRPLTCGVCRALASARVSFESCCEAMCMPRTCSASPEYAPIRLCSTLRSSSDNWPNTPRSGSTIWVTCVPIAVDCLRAASSLAADSDRAASS